jgi:hypothetical protein
MRRISPNKSLLALLIVSALMVLCVKAQFCFNAVGEPVSWWVVLKVPPAIKNSGYGYYDSNTRSGEFAFINKTIDLDVSALTQTISVLSSDKI